MVTFAICMFFVHNAMSQVVDKSMQMLPGSTYTPNDPSETLIEIAMRYSEAKSFSIYQTKLAIFQLNPTAFIDNDINKMIGGTALLIPSIRYVSSIDPAFARAKIFANSNVQQPVQSIDEAPVSQTTSNQTFNLTSASNEKDISQRLSEAAANIDELTAESRLFPEQLATIKSDLQFLKDRLTTNAEIQMNVLFDIQRELNAIRTPLRNAEESSVTTPPPPVTNSMTIPMPLVLLFAGILILGSIGYFVIKRFNLMRRKNNKTSSTTNVTFTDASLPNDVEEDTAFNANNSTLNLRDDAQTVSDSIDIDHQSDQKTKENKHVGSKFSKSVLDNEDDQHLQEMWEKLSSYCSTSSPFTVEDPKISDIRKRDFTKNEEQLQGLANSIRKDANTQHSLNDDMRAKSVDVQENNAFNQFTNNELYSESKTSH